MDDKYSVYSYNVIGIKRNKLIHATIWIISKKKKRIILLEKKAKSKKGDIPTVWVHLHKILEKCKLQWQKADQWLLEEGQDETFVGDR